MAQGFVVGVDLRIQRVLGLDKVRQQLSSVQGISGGTGVVSTQLDKISSSASNAAINTAKVNKVIADTGNSAQTAGSKIGNAGNKVQGFGDQLALAGRRYAAFIGATAVAFKAVQFISAGTRAVIEFDKSMVSLSQILRVSTNQLGGLSQQFLDLSVSTGTSAAEIANAAKLLAQAGFRGAELTEAVSQLAKVPLTPIFESMDQAVDGAIAAMRQFSNEGLTVETVFDKMINVSNTYAASFPDIIEGLKRGGSAFQAIGGTLDEFIAAFTTIRSVTRESASAVGTSLKTLSTRLADPKIIKFLETKNIRLLEKGQFVGPLEALKRIGDALERTKSVQEKVSIAVKLGGRRQVSRFLALSQNMEKNNRILETSKNSYGAFSEIAEKGLQAVEKRIDVLIAKSKRLAIQLGEDIFIPFITSLTDASSASIALLSALKPLLPILATVGTLVAGTAITRGIGKFLGPRLANLAGPAAFTAAGGGMKGAKSALGTSPFIQAGLLIAASEVAASFLRTADGANTFASTLVTSTALIAAAITLFRQQTIAQFAAGGGLLPSLGKFGAIATVGVIALPLAIHAANKSAQELSDKIIESAVLSIKRIDIQPADPQSLQRGLSDLYSSIGQSVQELTQSANVRSQPSIKKFAVGVSRVLSNIFEGDFSTLLRRGGLTERNVRNQVKSIIDKSPKVVEDVLKGISQSMVDITGRIDTTELAGQNRLIGQGLRLGLNRQQAGNFSEVIIESVGGLEAWLKLIRQNTTSIQKEIRSREKLIQLTKIFIPPRLVGQLQQFSHAVDKTVRAISTSARAFSSQISEIEGGIRPPSFDFDFGAKQIRGLISTNGLKDVFSLTPDIPKFISGMKDIDNLLDQFILTISSLPSDADFIGETDKFLADRAPQAIKDNFGKFFDTIAKDLVEVSEGKLITADEIKDRFRKEFADLGTGASDAVVENVKKFLQGTFAQIQDELSRLGTIREFEAAVSVRPESQADFLRTQLRRSGISIGGVSSADRQMRPRGTIDELDLIRRERNASFRGRNNLRLPTPEQGFFEGRGQGLVNIAGDESVRREVRESFASLTIELSEARKSLSGLKPGAEGFVFAAERAKELGRQVIELQVSLQALDQATSIAAASELETLKRRQKFDVIQRQAGFVGRVTPLKGERILFDLQKKHLQEQAELQNKYDIIIEKDHALRVDLAREISDINQAESQEFGRSINSFAESTRIHITAAELMQKSIIDFGQSVIDFKNLGTNTLPLGNDSTNSITNEQIRSGGFNRSQDISNTQTIGEGPYQAKQQEMLDIMTRIVEKRDKESRESLDRETTKASGLDKSRDEQGVKIEQLTESLDNLHGILSEPNELKLITDQRIDLDLSTLPSDISDEIRPLLEAAATLAAKTVSRKVMESLASKGDSELSIAATSVARELE